MAFVPFRFQPVGVKDTVAFRILQPRFAGGHHQGGKFLTLGRFIQSEERWPDLSLPSKKYRSCR